MIKHCLPAFALLILLSGCEPAPIAPDTPRTAAASSVANAALQRMDEQRAKNPLLNVPPQVFLEVIGDCGEKLFGSTPDAGAAPTCLASIRAAASKAGLGEISDAQMAEPYIAERWHSEMAKAAQH
ncbi:hypothetical protein JHS3_12530 [Jeongeupia sp. HS-3]|uniref:hypothetical protein n=1 Tax=Jeongeupia sp. HS-3 TaxID=1009682 RepID=UPI0018A5E635|nr:hypothetical protein [Jeongeupia sp. HS-3]BCL75517.1 hypothetical protein JHS3_12530 [Jeongeupia sp. HS-3]